MRIVFMGSGSFACPVAEALLDAKDNVVAAVVTQPDRPQGRNRQVGPCDAKKLAEARGAKVLTPEKIVDAVDALAALNADLLVVADYGQYIPQPILAVFPKRAINVHPSLLPKYRGAAPIQWAIANGEAMTGVTIQYVAKKMDSGDILLQQEFEIREDDSSSTLEPRLAAAGASLAARAVQLIGSSHVHATPQDEAHATLARKLTKEDGRIDWSQPARAIHNRVRGFNPWPSCFASFQGGLLKVLRTSVEPATSSQQPATLLRIDGTGPLVGTGEAALRLLEVQPEGKKPMSGSDWVRGYRVEVGATFNV